MGIVTDLFTDYTLRTVALGAAALGITSGALGSFALLRRQSLLGDAISHAALPGVALAYLLTGSKAPLALIVGAAIAGWVGTLLVMSIVRNSRVKYDSALGIVLSVFFGFGLVLLTFIQGRPDAAQAGLDRFLFGQAAALQERDVVTIAALGALTLGATALLWKEFKLLSFDVDFGATLGLSMRLVDFLLTGLLVVAIVIGLQTVGVVLMSAIVVAPAAAARQWTDRLGAMTFLAAALGALAGVVGAVVSFEAERMPTGPTIVLCATLIAAASLLLAPRRGLLFSRLAAHRSRRRLRVDAVLADLHELALQHPASEHAHPVAVLATMNAAGADIQRSLETLRAQGLAREAEVDGGWLITEAGRVESERRESERA